MYYVGSVPQRHAAGETTAARPALLMGGRERCAVYIVVVAPGTSGSVGRVLGNHYAERRWRCSFFVFKNQTEINRAIKYTYCCCIHT